MPVIQLTARTDRRGRLYIYPPNQLYERRYPIARQRKKETSLQFMVRVINLVEKRFAKRRVTVDAVIVKKESSNFIYPRRLLKKFLRSE